ncbi:serine/arginine repetitive matrix protein 1-like [Oryza brachyantha]|uniref:serine/arginine repetitive matrix protein 1-like n=1 Tax=Oryza brachyantha TaxID=4533 RepID=UPI001ADCD051|nr:serine/arginine repetitive matrix protein 1-like [Oryza brachyantha]
MPISGLRRLVLPSGSYARRRLPPVPRRSARSPPASPAAAAFSLRRNRGRRPLLRQRPPGRRHRLPLQPRPGCVLRPGGRSPRPPPCSRAIPGRRGQLAASGRRRQFSSPRQRQYPAVVLPALLPRSSGPYRSISNQWLGSTCGALTLHARTRLARLPQTPPRTCPQTSRPRPRGLTHRTQTPPPRPRPCLCRPSLCAAPRTQNQCYLAFISLEQPAPVPLRDRRHRSTALLENPPPVVRPDRRPTTSLVTAVSAARSSGQSAFKGM